MATPVVLLTKKRGLSYCSVYGCTNATNTRPDIAYFKHPNNPERRKKWLELIGRMELINKPASNYCVCEEHFHVRDIIFGKRRTLSATALPALNLPKNLEPASEVEKDPPVTIKTEVKKEIDDDIEPEEILPDVTRKRRAASPLPGCSKFANLELEAPQQANKVIVIVPEIFQKMCYKFLKKDLADLAKADSSLKKLLREKNRQKRNRMFCLNLYLTSPDSYHMLKDCLGLPSPKTLNVGPITTHINNDMMEILKNKVKSMTNQEKECSVLNKIISLKSGLLYSLSEDKIIGFQEIDGTRTTEPAVRAQVIMVHGIFTDWKQPVGYALMSKGENYIRLNEWIDGILEKLIEIGLKVRTFVSNTGNEFIEAAANRSVTIEKPYFFTGKRKIYYIFEAPHLILMARNHFQLYDFAYDDRVAKYEHIKLFYNKDKNKEFKSAPKLTKLHVSPTNLAKMNLKYATELFSNSVATGISNYITLGFIESRGKDTAEFIRLMNNLFDCFNSSDPNGNDNENKNTFCGNKSQIDFLNEMLVYFRKVQLLRPKDGHNFTRNAKFIEGFQTTIKSVLLLFEDLKSEGYTYLPTKRLNLKALDLFIDRIRMKTGMITEPTSWELVTGFRKNFFANILKPLKRKVNSKELSDFIAETKKIEQIIANTATTSKSDEDINIKRSDFSESDISLNCLFEVSHYLLMKCAEIHNCERFQFHCKAHILNPYFHKAADQYKLYHKYNNAKPGILKVIPSDAFVQFVKNMDVTFVACFIKLHLSNNLAASISAKLKELHFNQPCSCFPKDHLINLFVRFRIYNVLKSDNQQFRFSKDDSKSIIVKCFKNFN